MSVDDADAVTPPGGSAASGTIVGSDTVGGIVRQWAAATPESTWLVFERAPGVVETTTWSAAHRRATAAASIIRRAGLVAGDRFHIHLTNQPEFYDFWFAASMTGTVMVPTNPLLTAGELRYVVEHAETKLSITQPDLEPVVKGATGAAVLVTGPELAAELRVDGPEPEHTASPTDVLAVLYTSGTTSRPKGVLVTNSAYVHAGHVVAQHLRLRPDDRQLIVLPLFHGNAQYYSTLSALVTGASVALAPRFTASRWSAQARTMGATFASLFAAPIRMILAAPESADDADHGVRTVLFAQNISDGELERFGARFGCTLAQLYGMTETVAPTTINPVHGSARNHTMGRPTLGTRIRVDEGELLVAGEPGVTMMAGYLDDPVATARAMQGGWLHTGDRVAVDSDGYVAFVDRDKDVIKRSGENVSSTEVEAVINDHPAVFESAVIGVAHPVYSEVLVAVVVLHPGASVTEDELIGLCRSRLAPFKIPERIDVVEDLPRTSVGKVQKHVLRNERST